MSRRRLAFLACATTIGAIAPGLAHAAGGGLNIIPEWPKLLALLALFLILVPVLNALLFKPLLGVLDEREKRIDGARTRATELAQQAAALVARHDEAIRQARETAQAERARVVEAARGQHQEAIGDARKGAETEIAAARTEIARAAAGVRASLGAEAEPLARDIAARLLGRSAA